MFAKIKAAILNFFYNGKQLSMKSSRGGSMSVKQRAKVVAYHVTCFLGFLAIVIAAVVITTLTVGAIVAATGISATGFVALLLTVVIVRLVMVVLLTVIVEPIYDTINEASSAMAAQSERDPMDDLFAAYDASYEYNFEFENQAA